MLTMLVHKLIQHRWIKMTYHVLMCLVNKYFSTLEYGNVAKLVDQHERIMMLNAFQILIDLKRLKKTILLTQDFCCI
jgi:hypothetical protein